MEVTIVAQAKHQVLCGEAVRAGMEKVGKRASLQSYSHVIKTKEVVVWGWRLGAELRRAGHEVLVMERGYLGDRFDWFSLGWNGLNGHATFPEFNDGGERFRSHFRMEPWKEGGKYVLVLGQVPGDASLQGMNLNPWYNRVCMEAQIYGLPVQFRPHPLSFMRGPVYIPSAATHIPDADLDLELANAAVCITWNSNSAVDAVLAGVPTVTMNRGSMAWEVTGHQVGDLVRPPREEWASRLAWRQWKLHEIAGGLPFGVGHA